MEIYFVAKGSCGFVLPLIQNIVYINVTQGDYFGEIDFVFAAKELDIEIDELIERIHRS